MFLGAWKPDYKQFFEMVFPLLNPAGVFIAHDVVNNKNEMKPFLRTILAQPSIFTTTVSPSGKDMSIWYKTR